MGNVSHIDFFVKLWHFVHLSISYLQISPKYLTFSWLFLKVLIFYMPGKLACKIPKSLKKQGKRQISFGPTYRYTCICWFLFEHYQNTILVKFNIINSQCKLLLQIIVRGCFKASKLNWRPNENFALSVRWLHCRRDKDSNISKRHFTHYLPGQLYSERTGA